MAGGRDLACGAALGAGLMYVFDPERGRRRRARVRDRAVHLAHVAGDAVDVTTEDAAHRGRGLTAKARSRITRAQVDDDILVERARARLGRVVSHPRAIDVTAQDGRLTLSGPIFVHEVDKLLRAVAAVPGVAGVENRLTPREEAGDLLSLQGGRPRHGATFSLAREQWSPTARMLTGSTGVGLALLGAGRRGPVRTLSGMAGLGLLARALTNLPVQRLTGVGAGRRAVDVYKAITIEAPVEEVYAFWSNYRNFPRFMAHLRDVQETGLGRSHWVVDGPAGIPISWDAVVTKAVVNQELAWKTEGNGLVKHAGIVRFLPASGGTRLDVRLSYNPGVGAVGHAVATLFGDNPKQVLDDDLVRLKSLFENGKTTAHRREVTRPELTVNLPGPEEVSGAQP